MVREYWHPSSGDIGSSGVVNTCSAQRTFWCTCRRHTHTISTRALVGGHPEGYPCSICAREADSQLELLVRDTLRQLGVQFEVYPKILAGRFGPADMYIRADDLIVQVDGSQHR